MSFVDKALEYKPNLDADTVKRLRMLENWDFSPITDEMSPRLMLEEGRLFSVEQLVPLMLHFAQTDSEMKDIAQQTLLRWLGPESYKQKLAGLDPAYVDWACSKVHALVVRTSEEFRRFVAISMVEPDQVHAPSGPVDMFWHFMLLHTVDYSKFCDQVWGGHHFDEKLAS